MMKILKALRNKKGAIFISVLGISVLMIFVALTISNILIQDAHMIQHLKNSQKAQYLAEAGINDALATLVSLGFSAKDNPLNFIETPLGEGTFDVTVIQSGERVLLSSEGVVNGVSKTVALEVKDDTPTALHYMMSSGSNLSFRTLLLGWADINGDIHSNGDVFLHALWAGWIDIDACGDGDCDGSISATGTVDINEGFLGNVTYAGSLTEGAPAVTFPEFDFAYYKDLAIASGDYYSGNEVFDAETLAPGNGIVYVEGTARFRNECHLYGGIVADKIIIQGELNQHKSGTRNVILTRTDDIRVMYQIATEEALVYAGRDFRIFNAGSVIDITGILISGRYMRSWDSLSYVTYNHKVLYPDGLEIGSGNGTPITVVSWNK